MFEGGKGVYAEGFGTLDEHRVLPKRYPFKSSEVALPKSLLL
jgi:hypothetical protein